MRDNADRDIDIGLVADRTPRREQFVASAAGILWEWRTDIRLLSPEQPIEDRPSFAGTRILLGVHGADTLEFDWTGVADAIANGCVVACETSFGYEPLVPGVHFLMAPYEHLAEQAVALALDEPRRAAMAEAAREFATTALFQKWPRKPAPATAAIGAKRRRRRRHVIPRSAQLASLDHLLRELKAAFLAQQLLTRSIESTISRIEHDDPDHADVISTSAWESADAEVSVVVSLFNQGRHLADTVHSVIAASGETDPRTELIIVDDHSTDDSRAVAEALLADVDWFPATLVARAASGGPAIARNVGFNAARAPHVLHLGSGDTLYPSALRRLHGGLQGSPEDVVAAYGIVEQFDTAGPIGLTSHVPWATEQLVRGELIDSIAMFRRNAWWRLGGFPAGLEDGWEEYDMWLTIADGGLRAEFVGSVVGRSRDLYGAATKVRDVDVASSMVLLRERHPRLPWPS